ncbi:hypothetical protein CAOG_008144 [Capsaspora owczarzaki ATCC 30864]|uniref:Uncharacterized protein n=1 Tax=Capsaspora owczarzaki (strain ATCC 30864) TaxID=595528 RepID=A0A0D2WXV1_CAPO3|nr:hypothetical protein CAOG_008144 [Capsaspora owczarzaki ATCC 30864]
MQQRDLHRNQNLSTDFERGYKSFEVGHGDSGVRLRIRMLITNLSSRQRMLKMFALLVGLGLLVLCLPERFRISEPSLFAEAEAANLLEAAHRVTLVVTLNCNTAIDGPSPDPLPTQGLLDPTAETVDVSPDLLPTQGLLDPTAETVDVNTPPEQASETDTIDHPEEATQATLSPQAEPSTTVVSPQEEEAADDGTPKFRFFNNLAETKFSAIQGVRYMAFGSPGSDSLDAALMSANTSHILDLKSPPIFLYLTGHLRTFVQTAPELQRFVDSLERPYVIVQHTWSTTDHGDGVWWRNPNPDRAKQSSEEALAHLNYPFMQHAVIMIEDGDLAKSSGRLSTLPVFFPNQNNPVVLPSYYYSLQATHLLARDLVRRISGGVAMPQNAFILHSRPDVVIQSFESARLATIAKSIVDNPYSFFGSCHHDEGKWRSEAISDILYLTTRQVFDRLATVDIVDWCTSNSASYAIQSYPEVDLRLLLQFLKVRLYWLETPFHLVRDSGAILSMPACAGNV